MRRHSGKTGQSAQQGSGASASADLARLYNTGKLIVLKEGEVLFHKGEKDATIYRVVKGTLKAYNSVSGRGPEVASFGEGDWFGEIFHGRTPVKLSTVVATSYATVLALNEAAFGMMEGATQCAIVKHLSDRMAVRAVESTRWVTRLAEQNRYLTSRARTLLDDDVDYESSEVLSNLFRNLPGLPVHASRIMQLLLSEAASAREVAQVAKEDPSLVSQILKVINSPYYGVNTAVSDIQYAITYLGFNQIHQIVVSNGLRKTMPKEPEFQEVLDHSVIIANLAFSLCQANHRRLGPILSTVAILHDIGKSVALLLKKQNPRTAFFIDLLKPPKLGAVLLKIWNIPAAVYSVIRYQDYPDLLPPSELPKEERESVALLYVAHAVCDIMRGDAARALANPILPGYLEFLRFSKMSLQDVVDKVVMVDLKRRTDILPRPVRSLVLSYAAPGADTDIPTEEEAPAAAATASAASTRGK